MNQTKPKSFTLQIVAVISLLLIVFLGLGYKYFEWKTLKDLSSLYETSLQEEFGNIESNYELTDKMFYSEESKEKDKIFEEKEPDRKKVSNRFTEIEGDFRVVKDNISKTLTILKENKKEFEAYATKANLLMGKRKEFVKNLTQAQIKFYDNEIKDVEDGLVYMNVIGNDLQASKDSMLLGFFAIDTNAFLDEGAVKDYFRDIASLEKYTRDDFKFEGEDQIKESYSYAYESLKKQQSYFKATYLAIKDLVAGDKDSAYYKFSRIGAEIADLGSIDRDRMKDENKDKEIEIKKNLAEALYTRMKLLADFKTNGLTNYPRLSPVDDWSEDLSACYLYLYKTDLYKKMKDKYPKVNSLEELQKELAQITPDTSDIDKNIGEAVKVENEDDKYLIFTCKDESQDKTYVLKDHYEEEDKDEEEKEE